MEKETLQLLLEIKKIAKNNLCIDVVLLSKETMQQDMSDINDMIEAHLLERINK